MRVGKGTSRTTLDEKRATFAHIIIASSLFLVLLATGFGFSGHAAIDPLPRSAVAAREAKAAGEVVYTMPDGVYCRHVLFDNATAEITMSHIERCKGDILSEQRRTASGFAWRRNSSD